MQIKGIVCINAMEQEIKFTKIKKKSVLHIVAAQQYNKK